ncbi:hypothetical protein JCM24511_00974 [Saitozyma sp. JCM 24511]|nr:hypothetical protein JCM24511_00974 [Saitozyma sp. JCM 24511]
MSSISVSLHSHPAPNPSPSKANPFARPKHPSSTSSFTRVSLLPTIRSPQKQSSPSHNPSTSTPSLEGPGPSSTGPWPSSGGLETVLATPAEKGINTSTAERSIGKGRQAWRLLWRGGLEIGRDGWRLDGITFFALLTIPSTPSGPIPNPFDNTPNAHLPNSVSASVSGSPFALPSADTDLCLSLESMRGRKYLQVRGVVPLPEDEVLEGSEDGGVRMSIAPSSPLLAAYFTGLLCTSPTLSSDGRTTCAILIGLGDEGVDSPNSTILIYGQLQSSSTTNGETQSPGTLRLLVGRRKPAPAPPSAKKIRPGEPLPRAPLFFPAKAPRKPPPPFPRRTALSRSRSFSRAPSVSSIYHPPPPPIAPQVLEEQKKLPPPAPVSGRTPGRRGEKRRREDDAKADERRRKLGKIVPPQPALPRQSSADANVIASASAQTLPNDGADDDGADVTPGVRKVEERGSNNEDEDIFGKRPAPAALRVAFDTSRQGSADPGKASGAEPPSTGRAKRVRVPQQVLDNKAAIRKQTLVLLESRGVGRDHDLFKDVFGMTTKGTYFAFRDRLVETSLGKGDIQDIVARHLDMYLPPNGPQEHAEDDADTAAGHEDGEEPIKLDQVIKEEEQTIKLERDFVREGTELVSIKEEDRGDLRAKLEPDGVVKLELASCV